MRLPELDQVAMFKAKLANSLPNMAKVTSSQTRMFSGFSGNMAISLSQALGVRGRTGQAAGAAPQAIRTGTADRPPEERPGVRPSITVSTGKPPPRPCGTREGGTSCGVTRLPRGTLLGLSASQRAPQSLLFFLRRCAAFLGRNFLKKVSSKTFTPHRFFPQAARFLARSSSLSHCSHRKAATGSAAGRKPACPAGPPACNLGEGMLQ